ncbi:MAG: nuclear transport factor 2 family protein [Pseudomonadota bacterium]
MALSLSACIATINATPEQQIGNSPECQGCQQAPQATVSVAQACTDTADSYVYVRDRLLYEEYVALFSEDASFQIEGGPTAEGREQIVNALRTRGPAADLRHDSKVVHMQQTGAATASGVSYFTIWRADGVGAKIGKNKLGSPWVFGEYHDDYQMQGGRCLITKRLIKIVYQASGPEL